MQYSLLPPRSAALPLAQPFLPAPSLMFSGYRTILSRSTLRRTFASAIPDGLTLSHLHVSQPLPWELAAADALQGSFTSGVLLGQRDLPAEFFVPRDAAAALATGTRVQKLMTSSAKFQQTPIGFKIGATSKKAEAALLQLRRQQARCTWGMRSHACDLPG